MNNGLDIEELLHRAPQPAPPDDLLAELQRQMQISRPAQKSSLGRILRRVWIPATGLAGATAVLVVAIALWGAGTTRTLAQSVEALARVKSFRVIERARSGPAKPVIKDKTKPPQAFPNYFTPQHPGNPLVENQQWFKFDERSPNQGIMHSITPHEEIWQNGNLVLRVSHDTGKRTVKLNSEHTAFAGIAAPIVNLASSGLRFHEMSAAEIPDVSPAPAAAFWVGEARLKIGGKGYIWRIWIDRATELPVRTQLWSTAFPEVATEVLIQEDEFTDFNVDFPEETFAFAATDGDLAPLGITRADLANLPNTAFSVGLRGTAGAEIVGTVRDGNGVRAVRGTLPFSFVHVPKGVVRFDFRMADGQKRNFGMAVNGCEMETVTSRIVGKVTKDGLSSFRG